jgi:tetratricopeptide (TPR) repeat protein
MENYFEHIEKYINNELIESEVKFFESKIMKNPELARTVRLHKEIDDFLYDKKTSELREQLKSIHKKNVKKQNLVFTIPGKKKFYIAAAVLLLMASIGIIILLISKPMTNKEIYIEYAQAYDISMISRSNLTDILSKAMNKYQTKEYEQALIFFDQVIEKDPETISWINICIGISCTETNRHERAVSNFNKIINTNASLYIEQAQWFLALSYLKADKTLKAEKIFNKISADETHHYYKQALAIVEILSKRK